MLSGHGIPARRTLGAARRSVYGLRRAGRESRLTESVLTETEVVTDAPVETEREMLARLDKLVQSGTLHLTVDRSKLSHMDFPLSFEADGNVWVYGMMAATAAIWWQFGNWAGGAAAIASFAAYQTLGKAYVARRLDRRIRDKALKDTDTWRALWRFGGVILTPAKGGPPCQGPEGSWYSLVRGAARGEG
jgi:hypothetical protein